jgi:hypothetical protein
VYLGFFDKHGCTILLTLFDALDEREIARKFSDSRAFMAVPVLHALDTRLFDLFLLHQ